MKMAVSVAVHVRFRVFFVKGDNLSFNANYRAPLCFHCSSCTIVDLRIESRRHKVVAFC